MIRKRNAGALLPHRVLAFIERCEVTMGDVVNLNKFRKRKAKLEKEQRADTNRRLHGRTKEERARELLAKRQLDAKVDGARLTKAPEKSDPPPPKRK
jgi:hypothetical protein